jgi:hypothetical protein
LGRGEGDERSWLKEKDCMGLGFPFFWFGVHALGLELELGLLYHGWFKTFIDYYT